MWLPMAVSLLPPRRHRPATRHLLAQVQTSCFLPPTCETVFPTSGVAAGGKVDGAAGGSSGEAADTHLEVFWGGGGRKKKLLLPVRKGLWIRMLLLHALLWFPWSLLPSPPHPPPPLVLVELRRPRVLKRKRAFVYSALNSLLARVNNEHVDETDGFWTGGTFPPSPPLSAASVPLLLSTLLPGKNGEMCPRFLVRMGGW